MEFYLYEKMIEGGACGRERPDMVFDAGTHFVVNEVDEYQHKFSGYSCDCEQTRMVNVTQALQLPTVFIRYNPDSYTPKAGGRQLTQGQRLSVLAKVLQQQMREPP